MAYRENIVYVTLHRHNQTHLCTKLNSFGDNDVGKKFGIVEVVGTGQVSTRFVLRTAQVLHCADSQAKPCGGECAV